METIRSFLQQDVKGFELWIVLMAITFVIYGIYDFPKMIKKHGKVFWKMDMSDDRTSDAIRQITAPSIALFGGSWIVIKFLIACFS